METLFLAGIDNSGPGHWQRLWFGRLGGVWVEQDDWSRPTAKDWERTLGETLRSAPGPKLIVAHSLGCLTFAGWAREKADPGVRGAFLVAPPDPSSPRFPQEAEGFGDPFGTEFPFPILLAASRNDPYASFDFSRRLAERWGARLLDAGELGHINAASGLGFWEEGFRAFQTFQKALA